MKQYWTLAFLTLTGLAYGQEIIIPPADTTAVVGSNISFFCRVGFGPIETMSWEFNEAIVYSLQDGYEHYPCTSCGHKYAVTRNGGNFTLHVNALDLNDAGKYTCIAMVPSATAVLIVLDTPKISKSALSSAEGSIAEYTCKAQFAMPPKSEVLPKQNPVLGMFLAETTLNGVVREGNCDGLTNCYFYTQTEGLTLEASMNGMQLMCDISTSQPSMHVNNSTIITVLYSVRSISYTPDNKQYNVGNNITCMADGNPKPQYVWDNMNTGESIDGQTLYVTEEMLGPNTWICTAKNSIDRNLYKESTEVDFTAVMPGDYKKAGNASLGIGLGVTFAVCVLAIILTLLYCRIKHKKMFIGKKDVVSESQTEKSREGNKRKESEMKDSRAAKKRVFPILKNEKEDNANSAESTNRLLSKKSPYQNLQDQVDKVEKTKASDLTQKTELPLIKSLNYRHQGIRSSQENLSSRGEMSTGDKGREMKEKHAPDAATDETVPLLTKNIGEDKDEYSKQQSLKLEETPCSNAIPDRDQDTQDPQSSEPQLTKTGEDKTTDADDVKNENSRTENSDGSHLVNNDDESSTSDEVNLIEQTILDNQNISSRNADGSSFENDDTAESRTLSQCTSPENERGSNHSVNSGTEATILHQQGNTETTQPSTYDSDVSQPEKTLIFASPTVSGEIKDELAEENHSTEEGTDQPLHTGERNDELPVTDNIQSMVEGKDQPPEDKGESEAPADNERGDTNEGDDVIEIYNQNSVSPSVNSPSERPGNFGEICTGKLNSVKDVTIFRQTKFRTADQKKEFYHGGTLLKKYKHKNIAKFITITVTEDITMMLMEYETGGILQQFLQVNHRELGKSQMIKMCEDVLDGMIYLQKQPCILRALGAHSCLVGENNTVKIFNFSWAKEKKEYQGNPEEPVPIRSASLEALKQAKYTFSSDVWSFGVLLWEVFSYGKTPYGEDGETKEKLRSWLERGNILKTPEGTPSSISKLSETCLKTDPKRRPSSRVLAIKIKDAYKS